MKNAFTVDVEEWFHICGVDGALHQQGWDALPSRVVETTDRLLALLDRRDVRATFFVLGWVAEHHPELVARIRDAGHEVGSHGFGHHRVYEMDREAFVRDLSRSLECLTAAGCHEVRGFRAPEWSINDRSLWALDVLAEHGFHFDSSMTPLRLIGNPAYPEHPHERQTASGTIVEIPPTVGRMLGQNYPMGGGWGLRMHSPRHVIRSIEARNRGGLPTVLFVHPWEIDPDPPRVPLPLGLRFAHYFKLDGFARRLDEILAAIEFHPLGELTGLAHAVASG